MAKSRGGLGRGLAALIPTGPETSTISEVIMGGGAAAAATTAPAADGLPVNPDAPHFRQIPVTQIRPNPKNPRTVFDEDALDELAHSVKEFGLLQPIVVRPIAEPGGPAYELVMGERRWRAAQRAGVAEIAAIVRRTEDADMLRDALLENIHRSNLNPLEEAAAYQQLLEEFEVTHEQLAARLGRSRPVISNTIRLLGLPIPVQRRVAAGVLTAGHARALLALPDPGAQEELAARIVAEGLSVRGTEEAVTLMGPGSKRSARPARKPLTMPGVADLAARLSDRFDTRVTVQLGQRKGKIVVEFATVDDLERIVAAMAPDLGPRRS